MMLAWRIGSFVVGAGALAVAIYLILCGLRFIWLHRTGRPMPESHMVYEFYRDCPGYMQAFAFAVLFSVAAMSIYSAFAHSLIDPDPPRLYVPPWYPE